MSDLSNDVSEQDNTLSYESPRSSSRVMLVTMTLLIFGLLLTGTMMLHYANVQKGEAGDATAAVEKDSSRIGVSTLLEKVTKKESAPKAVAAEETAAEEKSGGFSKLFGSRSDKVRWPKLQLTGFGTSTDSTESFAIINNRQYHPGQVIDGKVELIAVRNHDVLVAYMGETNSLIVDVQN